MCSDGTCSNGLGSEGMRHNWREGGEREFREQHSGEHLIRSSGSIFCCQKETMKSMSKGVVVEDGERGGGKVLTGLEKSSQGSSFVIVRKLLEDEMQNLGRQS